MFLDGSIPIIVNIRPQKFFPTINTSVTHTSLAILPLDKTFILHTILENNKNILTV
jgi:hypothetical protein